MGSFGWPPGLPPTPFTPTWMCWYHLVFLTGPPLISKCRRSFLITNWVTNAKSPGFTDGPHMAISCCSFSALGETFPFLSVSPTLPMGNCVRMYTRSALKVRISSIRCCSLRGIELLVSAAQVERQKTVTKKKAKIPRRLIQPPLQIIDLGWRSSGP